MSKLAERTARLAADVDTLLPVSVKKHSSGEEDA